MRTKDFKVLASTCKSYSNRRGIADADAGIELHCTAILDEQTHDYGFNDPYNRDNPYCVGWRGSTSRYTCDIIYGFASMRALADKDGIHCSVTRIYGYIYNFTLYDISINIIRKGKNNTAHAICSCTYCIDVVEAHSCVGRVMGYNFSVPGFLLCVKG